jgi:crotonobetainyl-CoA:carnitine CoA-transferase CaiB-like acyl-CoA transferase
MQNDFANVRWSLSICRFPEQKGLAAVFAKSAERVRHRTELLPMIANIMRSRSRAYWLEALEKAGVPCSPVNDIGELAATEQLAAADLVHQLPEGGPRVVGLPICFDRERPHSARPAPKLGEHTDEVLGHKAK